MCTNKGSKKTFLQHDADSHLVKINHVTQCCGSGMIYSGSGHEILEIRIQMRPPAQNYKLSFDLSFLSFFGRSGTIIPDPDQQHGFHHFRIRKTVKQHRILLKMQCDILGTVIRNNLPIFGSVSLSFTENCH